MVGVRDGMIKQNAFSFFRRKIQSKGKLELDLKILPDRHYFFMGVKRGELSFDQNISSSYPH